MLPQLYFQSDCPLYTTIWLWIFMTQHQVWNKVLPFSEGNRRVFCLSKSLCAVQGTRFALLILTVASSKATSQLATSRSLHSWIPFIVTLAQAVISGLSIYWWWWTNFLTSLPWTSVSSLVQLKNILLLHNSRDIIQLTKICIKMVNLTRVLVFKLLVRQDWAGKQCVFISYKESVNKKNKM